MMKQLITLLIAASILFALGCSGTSNNPVVGDEPASLRGTTSNHVPFGFWQFIADPAKGTLEAVPLRMGDMHLNALRFLEPPVSLYLTVENLQFNGNIIEVDIGLRHPFLGLHQFTGFDARGVLISSGSITGFTDADIVMAGAGDTRLLNPDGLTRWWNPAEFPHDGTMLGYIDGLLGSPDSLADFSSTLNAYKSFCDDLSDPDAPLSDIGASSRCVFTAGAQNVRHYTIEIGNSGLIFNYAVDASWKKPDGSPPYDVPGDFSPDANCPEAWNAIVTETENTLWNDGVSSGGSLTLDIELWDHFDASLNSLYVESPGNFPQVGPITSGPVSQYTATYEVEILSATPTVGSIDILITAECEKTGYQGLLPDKPVSAYFMHTAVVGVGTQYEPPVAVAEVVSIPPFEPGAAVTFDASDSYDPDGGDIVNHEWDFDGDLSYGDPYDSGTDENPTKIFNDAGIYHINVQVTDDESDTDVLDVPLVVTISESGEYIWVDDDAVEPYLGTFDQPYLTIQDGVDAAYTDYPDLGWIMVKDGTYEENITMKSDIIVEGYSTPPPLIVSPAGSSANIVTFTSSDSSILKHFRIQPRGVTYGVVFPNGSTSCTIDDVEFIDNPGGDTCVYAVVSNNYSHFITINNVRCDGFHVPATGVTGFIDAGGQSVQVTDCVILNIDFPNAQTHYGPYVLLVDDGDSGALIARNVIGNVTVSGNTDDFVPRVRAMYISGCEGGTVRNNLIFDFDNNCTSGWTAGIYSNDALDMTFEHNTVSGISGPAWIYALETTNFNQDPSGVTHRDHIITDLTAGMMNWRWAYLGRWGSNLPVDYSCAYNVGNAFRDQVVQGTGCVFLNPMFVNSSGDDYRVSDGSPCDGTAHDGTDMGAYGGSDPLTWLPD